MLTTVVTMSIPCQKHHKQVLVVILLVVILLVKQGKKASPRSSIHVNMYSNEKIQNE